jgi:hypothetical protein
MNGHLHSGSKGEEYQNMNSPPTIGPSFQMPYYQSEQDIQCQLSGHRKDGTGSIQEAL